MQKRCIFKFLSEHIEQPQLTVVEILGVERAHASPFSSGSDADSPGDAKKCIGLIRSKRTIRNRTWTWRWGS
jgi:hypothetical protein